MEGLQVVTISSVVEDTPEGMFRMDRLREAERRRREELGPVGRALDDELQRRLDEAILCGTGCES